MQPALCCSARRKRRLTGMQAVIEPLLEWMVAPQATADSASTASTHLIFSCAPVTDVVHDVLNAPYVAVRVQESWSEVGMRLWEAGFFLARFFFRHAGTGAVAASTQVAAC